MRVTEIFLLDKVTFFLVDHFPNGSPSKWQIATLKFDRLKRITNKTVLKKIVFIYEISLNILQRLQNMFVF